MDPQMDLARNISQFNDDWSMPHDQRYPPQPRPQEQLERVGPGPGDFERTKWLRSEGQRIPLPPDDRTERSRQPWWDPEHPWSKGERERRISLSPSLPGIRPDVIRPPTEGYRPPPNVGPDKRTLDRMTAREQRGVYGERLDNDEVFFRHHYGNGRKGDEFAFDREALAAASPSIRARFSHLEHMRRVRTGLESGEPRNKLHAPGAHENLYRRAHYEGGVVMRDPKRPGKFYLGDPQTGRKHSSNVGSARMQKADQLMRNQQVLASSPRARGAAKEAGSRRARIKARRLWGRGRTPQEVMQNNIEAAKLMNNTDEITPEVAALAGLTPPGTYGAGQEAPPTPRARLLYSQTVDGNAYQREAERIATELSEAEPGNARKRAQVKADKALKELNRRADDAAKKLMILEGGGDAAVPGVVSAVPGPADRMTPDVYQNLYDHQGNFVGDRSRPIQGRADGSARRGLRLNELEQGWLRERERRYGTGRDNEISNWPHPITGRHADPVMRPHGPDRQTHFSHRDKHHGTVRWWDDESAAPRYTPSPDTPSPESLEGNIAMGYPDEPEAPFMGQSVEQMSAYPLNVPYPNSVDPIKQEENYEYVVDRIYASVSGPGTNMAPFAAIMHAMQFASDADKKAIVKRFNEKYGGPGSHWLFRNKATTMSDFFDEWDISGHDEQLARTIMGLPLD